MRKNIFPTLANETGACEYCLSENVLLLDPPQLADIFGPLINIYEESEDGKLLVEWLREDWGMFDHPRMDDHHARSLLADILDDGQIVRRTFAPLATYQTDTLDKWEKLREELMFGNRFFPASEINRERLVDLLAYLKLEPDEIPETWHRARLQGQDGAFPIDKMGAPPKRIASHGRANPAGIPYLYLASNEGTAISETRPHTGELACVADFTIPNDLSIADLRNPRRSVSPFVIGDEAQIGLMRGDIDFLARLGEELTRPVLPQSAAIDYVPSQYLCELIKKAGYDGVIYRSSVGDGINLALFSPERATPGAVIQRLVTRVQVETANA
ncbi:MAG: RES family NAD+ phosphorylase [Rhizobiaceae bacterium]|nr:RES family NAD+ phosphorylase [Rhizobiaceae bacterium]